MEAVVGGQAVLGHELDFTNEAQKQPAVAEVDGVRMGGSKFFGLGISSFFLGLGEVCIPSDLPNFESERILWAVVKQRSDIVLVLLNGNQPLSPV